MSSLTGRIASLRLQREIPRANNTTDPPSLNQEESYEPREALNSCILLNLLIYLFLIRFYLTTLVDSKHTERRSARTERYIYLIVF